MIDLAGSFENKILQAGVKDTAEAVIGSAIAIALMEQARQKKIENLLALADHRSASSPIRAIALEEAQRELLGTKAATP